MASTSAAEKLQSSALKESRNWADMPDELMENILQRLGTRDLFDCALKVCTSWRGICQDAAMWKVINMRKSFAARDRNYDFEMLTKQAVYFSCGELIDISIKYFGSDNLIDHIVLRSNKLKRLCLVSRLGMITGGGLIRAVKRLPQLEKLCVSNISINTECIKAIAHNCPQLKSLKIFSYKFRDDDVLVIANNMHELRHLYLYKAEITNNGLEAILNGCPHLESLYVRGCHKLDLDGVLGILCMERIKDFKHDLTKKEEMEGQRLNFNYLFN